MPNSERAKSHQSDQLHQSHPTKTKRLAFYFDLRRFVGLLYMLRMVCEQWLGGRIVDDDQGKWLANFMRFILIPESFCLFGMWWQFLLWSLDFIDFQVHCIWFLFPIHEHLGMSLPLAAWKRLRFEKRYDWFRDWGDKEVVKDPSNLSASAWCSWVILTKSFGWSMWIIIESVSDQLEWKMHASFGKFGHFSGAEGASLYAVWSGQTGDGWINTRNSTKLRYDRGLRGVKRGWICQFFGGSILRTSDFGIDQYSISYRNLLEISWYLYIYTESWDVYTSCHDMSLRILQFHSI